MTPDERLAELVRDWRFYGDVVDRDLLRRAVVVEMRLEVDKMAVECGLDAGIPPAPRRGLRLRRNRG